MGSNLNHRQFNIDCYTQKMLYTNLMASTNPKPVTDLQSKKRKKSNYITKMKPTNHKRREQGKKGTKNCKNNHETSNKMVINTYQSIITL